MRQKLRHSERLTYRNNLFILFLISLCLLIIQSGIAIVSAEDNPATLQDINSNNAGTKVTRISSTDKLASADYWNFIAIPTSYFTATNNGGETGSGEAFTKAFDRNFSTYWKSKFANNCGYTIDGNWVADYHNTVTASFKATVKLDRILYASVNDADGKGYPLSLKVYLYKDGTHIRTYTFNSTTSTSKTLFEFGEAVDCDQLTMEWINVNRSHYYNATASEIIFLQPDAEIPQIFSDFCKLTLSEDYDTQAELNALKSTLESNVNYDGSIKSEFDRAEKILNGELKWEARRQMSVKPSNGEPTLRQEGNMYDYMRNTLDFGWYGTNKQIIGISGQKGETLTIYVDGKAGDPLPSVICTQYFGHWSGWQTNEIPLSLGVNTVTIPTWDESKLTYPYQITSGGPIYIANPYKSNKQSDQVKVYVEGGQTYPIFRKGDDVQAFEKELKEYVEKRNSDEDYKSKTYDLVEFESDYTQMTIKASLANTKYQDTNNKINVQKNLENWDVYMRDLLQFDGVEFDKNGLHYSEENEHLRLNFRLAQPVGAAFGSNSQVGIFTDDWISGTITHSGALGWGMAHEIGHTMDTWNLNIGECSNNMISKYDETVRGAASRGNFAENINALSNDRTYAKTKADNPDYTYFDTNRLNFLVWWHVESLHPGTWGKVKNYYRYPDNNELELKLSQTTSGMSTNEKNIYYFSLASGVDLGEYFERFGYRLNTSEALFTVEGASAAYKAGIRSAKDAGIIEEKECTRYWYLDGAEYNYVVAGKSTELYGKSDVPTIKSVKKLSNGNNILMPKQDKAAHLGYEILEGSEEEGFEIIGFTNTRSFTDSSTYEEGYTPSYKVRAVDRGLNYSALSEVSNAIAQSGVCRIGDTTYDSLAEAINAAEAGSTITIIKDVVTSSVTVNKNLTIEVDSSVGNVSITRAGSGDLITVTDGALAIKGNGYLTIDGDDFTQYGSLIHLNGGSLNISSTTLKNNDTTTNGGAIRASNGKLMVESCTISGNSATSGGGICIDSKCTADYIKDTKIENNTAKNNGGGIFSSGGGIIYSLAGTTISNNKAANGGGLWLDGRSILSNAVINNNTASVNGGGIYICASNTARSYDMNDTKLENNKAGGKGNAIYFDKDSTKIVALRCEFAGEGDKVQGIYINNGSSIYFGESALPEIAFPESETIGIKQTDTGMYLGFAKGNGTINVGVAKKSGQLVVPEVKLGSSRTIDSTKLSEILENSKTEDPIEYYVSTDNNVIKLTDLNKAYCGHDNSLVEEVKAAEAGCITEGMDAHYACKTCGTMYTDSKGTQVIASLDDITIPATGHQAEKIDGNDAGCDHDGSMEYWHCDKCGGNFSDKDCTKALADKEWIVKAHGHSLVKTEAKEASCEEPGNLAYWYCSACDRYFGDEECSKAIEKDSWIIGAKQHSWDSDYTVDKAETCTTAGSRSIHCKKCSATKDATTISATDHKWDAGTVFKQSSCTVKGVKVYTCSNCKETKTEAIAANGHFWNTEYTVDKAASCTTAGSKSIHCKNCSATKDATTIPAEDHKWDAGNITKKPTCTEAGIRERHCISCTATKSETIAATDHNYVHKIYPVGKLMNGKKYDECSVCGDIVNSEVIPGYSTSYVKKFKLVKGSKSFTAKWKKQSKATRKKFNGYQIKYSVNSDMSDAKTVNVGKRAGSKKIKKLAKKKKYYVEIRSYVKKDGNIFYSKATKKTVVTK